MDAPPSLDWANTAVFEDIYRHIEVAAPTLIAVVPTDVAGERFYAALEALSNRIAVVRADEVTDDIGVVIALAESVPAARSHYAKLNALKDRGLAVVNCAPDRRFARQAPNWSGAGVTYDGMFQLAGAVAQASGAYVEFGVYDGRTLALAYRSLNQICDTFFAFDSYAGIGGALAIERTHFDDGQYYANVPTVLHNMRFIGADLRRIRPVRGFFEQSLKTPPAGYGIEKASVVHIDTDVYAPALLALNFITPALPQGAVLLFDDYDQLAASNNTGERRAVREWLSAHPDVEIEPYRAYAVFGRSFLVHRS